MSVFFYGCVTLDGYLADKNHGLSWLYETGATEETGYEDFYRKMDVTIMGRRTFEEIAPVLLGEGIPLFTQKEGLRRFHLEEVKRSAELVFAKKVDNP